MTIFSLRDSSFFNNCSTVSPLKSKIVFGNNCDNIIKLRLEVDETDGGLYVI